MRIVTRLVLFGALLLPACMHAADIGSMGNVAVVRVPNGGQAVGAQVTKGGTIHLLYNSGDIPYYVKSSDDGASFTSPIAVVDAASRKPGLVFSGMSMAVGKGNTVYVAMISNNWQTKLPDVPVGLIYATLAPGGKAFTPVRSLNQRPSEGFSLAADGNGDVAASWLSGRLFANFSRDGGGTFTPNAEINNTYLPCECCTTSAVYGADGNLAVLYRERTNNERDMYLVLVSKDGRPSRARISSTSWKIDGCPMTYYMISTTKEGYVAAWPTKGDIYFARLDRNGKVLPPGEIKTPGHSSMRSGVVALSAPNGESLAAWKHEDELGWQLYDTEGRPEGGPGSVKSPGKGAAGVVDKNGRFILFQ
jgi:hypothetical protein